MRKTACLAAMVVLVTSVSGAQRASPRPADAPEVQLKAAIARELVEGETERAIERYKQIASQNRTSDPAIAARAMVQMAQSYERLGSPEARVVYQTVALEFGDRLEGAEARTWLSALTRSGARPSRAPQTSDAPRRVLADGPSVTSVRADGLVAVGHRHQPDSTQLDIVSIDLVTGSITELVDSKPGAYGLGPVLSPDGQHVAYGWIEDPMPGNRSTQVKELRVIGTAKAATPRSLMRGDGQTSSMGAAGWSADGKMILVSVVQRIASPPGVSISVGWLALSDGRFRAIKEFASGERDGELRISPDGKSIAYAAAPRAGSPERHIIVMDSNGENSTVAVQMAARNVNPTWAPDSSRLLFTSDRSGTAALWSVSMSNGRPMGEPTLVQDRFSGRPLGMTTSGNLLYSQPAGGERLVLALDTSAATPRVLSSFIGNDAALSPNGRMVAFYRRRGSDVDIVVRSLDGGQEQASSRAGLRSRHPLHWLHSNAGLVLVIEDADSFPEGTARVGSFYQLNLSTRTFTRLAPWRDAMTFRSATVGLSPDDSTLYVATQPAVGSRWTQLAAIEVATGIQTPLVSVPEPGFQSSFAPWLQVSPDGRTLAIHVYQDIGAHLFTVRSDGTDLRKVHGPFPVVPPDERMAWSPDSQSILFTVTDSLSREWRLMKVSVGGGSPSSAGLSSSNLSSSTSTPLSRAPGPGHLSLSADGARMTLGVSSQATQELWVVGKPGGSNSVNIAHAAAPHRSPRAAQWPDDVRQCPDDARQCRTDYRQFRTDSALDY